MAAATARQLLVHRITSSCSSGTLPKHTSSCFQAGGWNKAAKLPSFRARVTVKPPCAVPGKGGIVPADDDGVSLGTVKLPANIDVARFEGLLFQWGNSLCQGAMLPLPVPIKVDKVEGGIRLGFIGIDDGATSLLAYIDCLVSPATDGSGFVFRAIRNGAMKDMEPPGEPRIMRSLLMALQKSIQIARV
ncbi:hypothetical protein CFC21_037042 [Triticum aestivum]|uniref:DUF7148 domain-containing protein n=3 Tax=Triticum TaxID=4564 RepID=A0A9R0RSG8_TRITD|nr:uncharacterized protein LOC119269675 [Triticum dicoccoides]XP_044342263.1 uncharacterized protein LOC123062693 [Triticum aestivum]XP_048549474.1 uncharacterized protein LOC125529114 [Triticum urartu]KAF7024739.1 hypothetical protein CFC21_037042 [Triticum aestivum]VAH65934.1 unnamed protein product [Triticum turgidum subsp. durum]